MSLDEVPPAEHERNVRVYLEPFFPAMPFPTAACLVCWNGAVHFPEGTTLSTKYDTPVHPDGAGITYKWGERLPEELAVDSALTLTDISWRHARKWLHPRMWDVLLAWCVTARMLIACYGGSHYLLCYHLLPIPAWWVYEPDDPLTVRFTEAIGT